MGHPPLNPSSHVYVLPGGCHFDNGPFSFNDNVLLNHGGLPYVVLLGVHLETFYINNGWVEANI